MKKLSQEIVDTLLLYEYISAEKRAAYIYCYSYIIENIKYDLTMLLTGVLLHRLNATITFILCFNIYRSFCGGYHAKTPIKCNITSYLIAILYFGGSFASSSVSILIFVIPFSISNFIITFFSPVDCTTKKYTDLQRTTTKKIVLLATFINIIIFVFFAIKNQTLYCYSLTFCVMVIAITLIVQIIINTRGTHYDNEYCNM